MLGEQTFAPKRLASGRLRSAASANGWPGPYGLAPWPHRRERGASENTAVRELIKLFFFFSSSSDITCGPDGTVLACFGQFSAAEGGGVGVDHLGGRCGVAMRV